MKLLLIAFDAADAVAGAGFAQALGLPFDVLAFGDAPSDLGAGTVFAGGLSEEPLADAAAAAIVGQAGGYSHLAAVSSMRAKDVLGRVAGLLDAAAITDAVAIESPTVFVRPIYAGSALATVEAQGTPIVVTFRPSGFPAAARGGASAVQSVDLARPSAGRRVAIEAHSGGRPDLSQAKVVVSGGRPLKDAETFERVVGGAADRLGGAVGATRAAVDSGIAPNELQVGQTGKIVAPDLYIAAGISGSTQHMAGIKDSKTIVAINTDPDAPIFEIADLGLVQDLYTALPEVAEKLGA